MDDDELVALATKELDSLGLASPEKVRRGYVVRVPLAYPMYDTDYSERVDTIKGWLAPLEELPAGRAQRPAPLQQLRPLDAQRDARGGQTKEVVATEDVSAREPHTAAHPLGELRPPKVGGPSASIRRRRFSRSLILKILSIAARPDPCGSSRRRDPTPA